MYMTEEEGDQVQCGGCELLLRAAAACLYQQPRRIKKKKDKNAIHMNQRDDGLFLGSKNSNGRGNGVTHTPPSATAAGSDNNTHTSHP
jgi:hypothetical protein